MLTAKGLLFYYPLIEGMESKPFASANCSSGNKRKYGNMDFESCNDDSTLQKIHGTSVFSIFWHNRLVPETVLNRFPLFKNIFSDIDCDRLGIARNWKNRLKGFLFFDGDFNNIKTSKLITMEPSLEAYLENLADKDLIWTPPNSLNLFEKYAVE